MTPKKGLEPHFACEPGGEPVTTPRSWSRNAFATCGLPGLRRKKVLKNKVSYWQKPQAQADAWSHAHERVFGRTKLPRVRLSLLLTVPGPEKEFFARRNVRQAIMRIEGPDALLTIYRKANCVGCEWRLPRSPPSCHRTRPWLCSCEKTGDLYGGIRPHARCGTRRIWARTGRAWRSRRYTGPDPCVFV